MASGAQKTGSPMDGPKKEAGPDADLARRQPGCPPDEGSAEDQARRLESLLVDKLGFVPKQVTEDGRKPFVRVSRVDPSSSSAVYLDVPARRMHVGLKGFLSNLDQRVEGHEFGVALIGLERQAPPNNDADAALLESRREDQAEAAAATSRQEPFDIELIPAGAARDMVEALSGMLLQDASWAALPLLTAASSLTAPLYRLEIKPGWRPPALVWSALLGNSGTNKSQPIEVIYRPFVKANRRLIEQWCIDDEAYAKSKALQEAKLKAAARSQEAWKEEAESDEAPLAPPKLNRLVLGDMTLEAAAQILADSDRLVWPLDELSTLHGTCNRYSKGGADVDRLLSLYNALDFTIERRTRKRTTIVQNPIVGITGGDQPLSFLQGFGEGMMAKGLPARFMMTYPNRRQKTWTENGISQDVEAHWEWLFDRMLAVPCDPEGGWKKLLPSPGAKALFIEWYNAHNALTVGVSGHVLASHSKIEELPLRLAPVLHFIKAASAGRSVSSEISTETMREAIQIAWWQRRETERIYSLIDANLFLDPDAAPADSPETWAPALLAIAVDGVIDPRKIEQDGPRPMWRPLRKGQRRADAVRERIEMCFPGGGKWERRDGRRSDGRCFFVLDRKPSTLSTASTLSTLPPSDEGKRQPQGHVQARSVDSVDSADSVDASANRAASGEPAEATPPAAAPIRTLTPEERQARIEEARRACEAAAAAQTPPDPKPPKSAPPAPRGFGFTQEGGAS